MKSLWFLIVLGAACVTARATIFLREDFAYTDGVLTNVSGFKWRTHGGAAGEVNVASGRLELNRAETEDVNAAFATSAITPASGGVIYSRFTFMVTEVPASSSGGCFAHCNGASSQRGKIYVTASGAGAGTFRLGVANSSGSPSRTWPGELLPYQTYTVVTRYVVSNAVTTLWIDPVSEASASITAVDAASPTTVSAFAWRQDGNVGVMLVDDLFVAGSFAEALAGDAAPVIFAVPPQQVAAGGSTGPIPFSVSDAETEAEWLDVWAYASDSNLVQNIAVIRSGTNCSISISLAPQLLGSSTITICATDGNATNRRSFLLSAVPALLFADDFAYADGMLISNAAPTWVHHGGGTGEVQVVGGQLAMGVPFTEDVHSVLPFGPFPADSGLTFYASLRVNFSELPGSSGDYVAHFNASSGRCRLIANAGVAASGKFRLAIANANVDAAQPWPVDLTTNVSYLVVLRYEAGTATSTLWVNPVQESDRSTNAVDAASPVAISAFAFRQSASIGKFTVDDLRVGLSFGAVTAAGMVPATIAPRLRIECVAPGVMQIAWPAVMSEYRLQSNTELKATGWYDVDEWPELIGDEYVVTKLFYGGSELFRLRRPANAQ